MRDIFGQPQQSPAFGPPEASCHGKFWKIGKSVVRNISLACAGSCCVTEIQITSCPSNKRVLHACHCCDLCQRCAGREIISEAPFLLLGIFEKFLKRLQRKLPKGRIRAPQRYFPSWGKVIILPSSHSNIFRVRVPQDICIVGKVIIFPSRHSNTFLKPFLSLRKRAFRAKWKTVSKGTSINSLRDDLPIFLWEGELSTPNMTGRTFHHTMEMIPRPPLVV